MAYKDLSRKGKADTTRLFNLLNQYRDHIITIYLRDVVHKRNITEAIDRVDTAIKLIKNNLD